MSPAYSRLCYYRLEKGFHGIRRAILIVVNARSGSDKDWEKKEAPAYQEILEELNARRVE